MSVSDAHRLRPLEDESVKLKRLPADAMLDKAALNDLLSKTYGPDLSQAAKLSERPAPPHNGRGWPKSCRRPNLSR